MDGYADTLERALYLLRYLDVPEAAEWVDEQVGVLYGFQGPDGAVTDENIDGNFIRTALLYGLTQTAGARLEPWTDGIGLGAARDGACLQLSLHAEVAWQGHLLFDTPRHRAFVGLPTDYPRLNQWPERWAVDGSARYALSGDLPGTAGIDSREVSGDQLATGLPIVLEPGRAYQLRACPG